MFELYAFLEYMEVASLSTTTVRNNDTGAAAAAATKF